MSTCALCDNKITSANDSKEHIIPQSIGGREKVRGFICRACNNTTGETWDAKLASQYNWFSVALNIKRESGSPPSHHVQTVDGQGLLLHADGTTSPDKPVFTKTKTPDGYQISVKARTMAEARKILKGIQREYPKTDVEKTLADAVIEGTYTEEPIKTLFQFGGELAGRSFVKTAVAMAFDIGIDPQECDFALCYLKNTAVTPAYAEFHLRDLVANRPPNQLFNSVTVSGNPTENRLTAYIEYFGVTRIVIHLSQTYTGPSVHKTYAFDPVTGQRIHLDVDLNLSDEEYALSLANKTRLDGSVVKAFDYAMPILLKSIYARQDEKVLNDAIMEAFEAMGIRPDGELAPEQIPAFTAYLTNKITPYLMQVIKNRPKL